MSAITLSPTAPILDSQRRKKKDLRHYTPPRPVSARPPPLPGPEQVWIGYRLRGWTPTTVYVPPSGGIVLPSQLDHERQWSSEQKLIFAVLVDALEQWDNGVRFPFSPRAAHQADDVRNWILSPEEDWPFSFLNICLHLGIDTGAMRSRVVAGQVVFPAGAKQRLNHR